MASVYKLNVKPNVDGERGLPKRSVPSSFLSKEGFDGDFNVYRTKKKDRDPGMAVLVMTIDVFAEFQKAGWPVKAGDIGENIIAEGLGYREMIPGNQYRVGQAIIEVVDQATPCKNLKVLEYVGQERLKEFQQLLLGRRGWYCQVIQEGLVCEGDSIESVLVEETPFSD